MDAQGRQRCVQEYFPHLSSSPIIIIIVVQTIHDERQIKLKLNLEFGAKYFGPSDELNSTQSKVGGSVLLSTLLITLSSSSSFSYVFTLAATIMVSCCCWKRKLTLCSEVDPLLGRALTTGRRALAPQHPGARPARRAAARFRFEARLQTLHSPGLARAPFFHSGGGEGGGFA